MPLWIEELGPAARRIDGVVQFHLAAGDDTRTWYADFTLDPPIVLEDRHPSPQLSLTFDEDLVRPLLDGTLELERALAAGTLAVEGDLAVLERWVELMAARISGMGTLYASVRTEVESG